MCTMKLCLDQFQFTADRPRLFEIQGRDDQASSWEDAIKKNINPKVQFVVFILPGQKGKGKCYSEIKKLLIKSIPVPSQVVLASTINKGKNLRSICNKILIQMNSKMGGIPWSISELPFFDKPTMVCGIDTFSQRGQKSIIALVASVNKDANRYFSRVKEMSGEFGDQLTGMFTDAIEAFAKACGGHYPQRIIIYRNGVGEGQKQALIE